MAVSVSPRVAKSARYLAHLRPSKPRPDELLMRGPSREFLAKPAAPRQKG